MTEQLTIELPAPMAAELRSEVEAGAYASASEAVQAALHLWLTRQNAERDSLRAAWDEGKASGPYGRLDFDEHRLEARRLLFAERNDGCWHHRDEIGVH